MSHMSACNKIFIIRSLPVQLHGSCCPRSTEQILSEAPHHPQHGEVCCVAPIGWRPPGTSHPFLSPRAFALTSTVVSHKFAVIVLSGSELQLRHKCRKIKGLQPLKPRNTIGSYFRDGRLQGSRPAAFTDFRYSISGTNAETFSRRSE